jgi:adenylate cyclase
LYARLERKLRLLAVVTVASAIGGVAFAVAEGLTSPYATATGIAYGLLLGITIEGISLFVLQGPMRPWLGSLSFTANLMVRTAIYAAIIVPILYFQLGDIIARVPPDPSHRTFWISIVYSVVFLVLANLVLGVANIIGPRAFLSFVTGRYHFPVEESRSCFLSNRGIDRAGRAAGRDCNSPPSRSHLPFTYPWGRRLSR